MPPMKLIFKDGNVLEPEETGNLLLVHCCNNIGAFGSGIAGAIAKKWPHVRKSYIAWCNDDQTNSYETHRQARLGEIQVVKISGDYKQEDGLAVVNLIGQQDVGPGIYGMEPIRYEAIKEGLYKIKELITTKLKKWPTNIVMPRMGCSLAMGKWSNIEKIIYEVFEDIDVNITVYTFGPFNP